jgi:hypothetical protein
MFNSNVTSVILAHEKDAIQKLFRIVLRAYEFMPEKMRPTLDRGGGSKYELFFPEINSRIYCDLESRGDTISWLHVSEVAFMKDPSRLRSTMQAVPIETGIITQETTPNGMGNFFYDEWNDPDTTFVNLFFPWYLHDEYQLPCDKEIDLTDEELELKVKAKRLFNIDITHQQIMFRRFKKSELRSSLNAEGHIVTFEQEYPEDDQTCFLSSGQAVMDLIKIKELINKADSPIEDRGWLKIYERPEKTKLYACGADTAEGVGGDFSVGVLYDVKTLKIVAKIRGQWKPFEFAHKLNEMCQEYKAPSGGPPLLAVERNNHGHAVILELHEHINYENLYMHTDEKLGWKTDMVTRPVMLNTFIHAMENDKITCDDKEILGECLTLINDNGKIQASPNKHDDCIIGASIGLQISLNFSSLDLYENIEAKVRV